MPHIIPIPGLFVKDPQPLKEPDLASFMESATEDGVIVRHFWRFKSIFLQECSKFGMTLYEK